MRDANLLFRTVGINFSMIGSNEMANMRNLLVSGETFEFRLMSLIRSAFPEAIILHDLHVNSSYLGKETQIDVVAVTECGVFVIEAKNWKHWIKGNYDDHQWSGLTNERKTITVFNPYHQNFIHVRTLRNAIRRNGTEPKQFYNIVVLPDGTNIYSDCKEVINLSALTSTMRKLSNDRCISPKEYARLIEEVLWKN